MFGLGICDWPIGRFLKKKSSFAQPQNKNKNCGVLLLGWLYRL
jgi:hypothetical protein